MYKSNFLRNHYNSHINDSRDKGLSYEKSMPFLESCENLHLQNPPKKTLVHFSHFWRKSNEGMKPRFSVNVWNKIEMICAKNLNQITICSLAAKNRVRAL